MRIFLHIGAEKTGTSSVQRFFSRNREALKAAGYLYPASAGNENHMALAAAAQNDDVRDDLRMIYQLGSVQSAPAGKVSLPEPHPADRADERRQCHPRTRELLEVVIL